GALIERDSALDLAKLPHLSLLLNDANFTTAEEVAAVIKRELPASSPTVVDSRRVEIQPPAQSSAVPALLAHIENLEVTVRRRAKVVVNERTGTVVLGKDVHLGAVSILHGSFSIEVKTQFAVSQPAPLSKGRTELVPQTQVSATETPARNVELG